MTILMFPRNPYKFIYYVWYLQVTWQYLRFLAYMKIITKV